MRVLKHLGAGPSEYNAIHSSAYPAFNEGHFSCRNVGWVSIGVLQDKFNSPINVYALLHLIYIFFKHIASH